MNMQESDVASKAFKELIEDMELESFPENEKEQLLLKLTEVVTKRVFVEAMEKIGESGRIEYEKKILEDAKPEELRTFFSEKIENFDNLVLEVIEKLRAEMASETS